MSHILVVESTHDLGQGLKREAHDVDIFRAGCLSKKNGQITLQPVLINKSKFLKATHRTKIRKMGLPRSMVVEALSW